MDNRDVITLPNGARIVFDAMPGLRTASVGVYLGAGARHEPAERNGLAHFLEHMAFKGTKKRSAKQIAEEFEGIGGYINAYTSREKTVYYVKVLKEYGEFAVEFLADILQNSLFDKQEINKECEVILQELAMTIDTPDDIIFDHFQEIRRCIDIHRENAHFQRFKAKIDDIFKLYIQELNKEPKECNEDCDCDD
jgi:predicted Zn-dependent peptidase